MPNEPMLAFDDMVESLTVEGKLKMLVDLSAVLPGAITSGEHYWQRYLADDEMTVIQRLKRRVIVSLARDAGIQMNTER